MGNQLTSDHNQQSSSPFKKSKSIFSSFLSGDKKEHKSPTKESLYSQDKLFENFENTEIYGFRLDSDPEDREYYVNCPQCNKLLLDCGLANEIICKLCNKKYDVDELLGRIPISSKKCGLSFPKPKKSRKPNEISSLVLLTNKDTLLGNFYDSEREIINYDLLMKKILLPYFKMKSRVVKIGMDFKIGEIGFKVAGLNPVKKGIVSSKTLIRCQQYYSVNTIIKRALMITTQKYDHFSQELLLKDIFSAPESHYVINKSEISKIRQYEFYIRNCEPDSGVITRDTHITIENREIMGIAKIKLAVIKNNIPHFQNSSERKKYEDYIFQEYIKPYFLAGVKKYVERGDTVQIEDLEIFVLNSFPDHGFISSDSIVLLKFGLNKEKCLEKINNADNKYAFSLLNLEEEANPYSHDFSNNLIRHERRPLSRALYRTASPRRMRSLDDFIIREFLSSTGVDEYTVNCFNEDMLSQEKSEEIIRNLPTFTIDENYKKSLDLKRDDGLKKCVICMDEFKVDEVLKTLPCFHIFHCHCIDEWLKANSQCPICKSAIAE